MIPKASWVPSQHYPFAPMERSFNNPVTTWRGQQLCQGTCKASGTVKGFQQTPLESWETGGNEVRSKQTATHCFFPLQILGMGISFQEHRIFCCWCKYSIYDCNLDIQFLHVVQKAPLRLLPQAVSKIVKIPQVTICYRSTDTMSYTAAGRSP